MLAKPPQSPPTDRASAAALAPPRMLRGTVVACAQPCDEHFTLTLDVPNMPLDRPGQFVQLQADAGPRIDAAAGDDAAPGMWSDRDPPARHALLRRPFSIAGSTPIEGGRRLVLVGRVVGPGTAWLSQREPGDGVGLIGPLGGAGFWLWPHAKEHWLVGGGVGIPPMMRLAQAYSAELTTQGSTAIAFAAGQRRDLLALTTIEQPPTDATPTMCLQPFADFGVHAIVSTDDGSLGVAGRVTEALRQRIAALTQAGESPSRQVGIYVCGSTPMMRAVAELAAEAGIACQVCLEQAMACGLGTCQSCVVRISEDARRWRYRLCCTDGPVWDARHVVWNRLTAAQTTAAAASPR